MPLKFKPIQFPQDEQAHDNIIEWWYFNGHLQDRAGNRYAFMDCLFKTDVKRCGIPFLSRLPVRTAYFAHSILSDIEKQESYPEVQNMVLASKDSFTRPLLFINYINPPFLDGYATSVIEETALFEYRVKTENFDLHLTATKKPLLESGRGMIEVCGKQSFYYSLTSLQVVGQIKIDKKFIEVTGRAWMDHQWADEGYPMDQWSWFSVQLENNIEIMCCEYIRGKDRAYLADIVYADGRQESFKNLKLTAGKEIFHSKKTNAKYPLNWQIEISEKDIKLDVTALLKNQEMVYGSISYWEGPSEISGAIGDKKVKGLGFIELAGYPSNYSNLKYAKDEFQKVAKDLLARLKKR
ncbi:MAG: lipocalin-like domain-containing protein [Patescibacteria group bacterium]